MIAPPREMQLEVAAAAGRAPSAHNTQPARWRFSDRGSVLLYEDPRRALTLADPTGRDQAVALGAAWEGMRIALSLRGIGLSDPARHSAGYPVAAERELRLVARGTTWAGASADPLAPQVMRRRSYRRAFRRAAASDAAALRALLGAACDVQAIVDPTVIAELAGQADHAAAAFLRERANQSELIQWLRFAPRDASWSRDGLTADCLGLSAPERWAARVLFTPARFARLAHAGWHGPLLSEAARLRTAAAFAVFHRPKDEDRLATGRRFYRWWLELTAAGFAAQPVSILVDDARTAASLRERCALNAGEELINVLAIGRPRREAARSPRLPAEELLV